MQTTTDKLVDERQAAYARVAHQLNAALDALITAQRENRTHSLGLELPAERQFIDAINACAARAQQEKT